MRGAAKIPEPPVGVVLAGGRGRRLGGDKAIVELEGRPLIQYVLEALHEVCDDVAVVAKRDTLLPALAGTADLWIEPDEPRHPLTGVAHALQMAAGRSVLAVAVDLPLIDAAPRAAAGLATFPPDARATGVVRSLGARELEGLDPTPFYNVNAPEDLLQVSVLLAGT
jgi:molybdenum cofactor guanylyltransferase